jgi:large subunit ribosomal protein L3e
MGFCPRKRCTKGRARISHFPQDNKAVAPHFTAFMGYKVGMTHIVRDLDKPGSSMNKKEVVEAVTIIECPPMIVCGLVGYIETPFGNKTLATIWANHLSNGVRRRNSNKWFGGKKLAFVKHMRTYS